MSQQLSCIIVDDDNFSTKIMSGFVSKTTSATLVQVFSNAIDAINFLSTPEGKVVNLVFLDIEMPEMNGIEFMRSINLSNKEIIIYSSQEKYALESYEYDVCDYLLKPVSYARFIRAVTKAQTALTQKAELTNKEEGGNADENIIVIKDNLGTIHKINYLDIIVVQAMENYVSLVTTKVKIFVHVPMKKLLAVFPTEFVKRVHRSYAVGIRHVTKIDKDIIRVENGSDVYELPVSRTYCSEIKKMLSATIGWEE